ncbi:secretion/DNA translocation related CpaE-like protein [Branchiibius hedensis]|uniref:Helicase/secretion neighborhood CpaE-like protein n=1 Tax=Branchiibius hedensis TaxID=672460 RepID=A0A2Y8ZXP8_9MICO|nr:hypothetical protein [Branchiibius hedensis]PWJ27496.1 secretion/DNA translocation related CpaE-like protein [Branchiibius hedensis]SSA36306.1 helicase/secretion neighborhood CpaE-like protein [Branchiibius hedensis]
MDTTAPLAPCLAVVGAGGSCGASTLATALTVTAARAGWSAVAVDADPWGGGLDNLFDLAADPGVRWPDLLGSDGALPGQPLLDRLPSAESGARVVACDGPDPIPPGRLSEVVAACRRASDLVVVDLPRDLVLVGEALAVATALIVVTAPDRRVLVVTEQLVGYAQAVEPDLPVGFVVRDTREHVAQQIARLSDVPLLGVLPHDRKLDQRQSNPAVPGSSARSAVSALAASLLRDLIVEQRLAS